MTDPHDCADHDATHQPERVHYFAGQMLGADDFTQEQSYLRTKQRLHNRLLHGWGVVAGLHVSLRTDRPELTISPGFALDPCGAEILVSEEVVIDVAEALPPGVAFDRTFYLAIRYAEEETAPAPAASPDGEDVEYGRVVETYEMALLNGLPDPFDPMPSADFADTVRCSDAARTRPFPPPDPDPWIVLADLEPGDDGSVGEVDPWAHRRVVSAFGEFSFSC